MTVNQATFSILITTKNRKTDLAFTLSKIKHLLDRDDVECVVFDDGSVDGTYEFIKENFSSIQLERNSISKGYIFCRNKMLNETKSTYAISLDDDAHFVTQNPLESILYHFEHNANCGLIAFRIFWGLEEPNSIVSNEENEQVQGYVGCAHVWRMNAWRTIPNYPEWFVFYGEESFASYQLYKKNWKVLYVPQVLVNHRVELQSRKNNADFGLRLRQSLRSGWYLMLLFYPMYIIPKKIIFTLWVQLKSKVFKGDFKALKAILNALFDLVLAIPKIIKSSNRLSKQEYEAYCKLPKTKVYW
jgi:glycosyltransferase involved in cell wall biosynthesis